MTAELYPIVIVLTVLIIVVKTINKVRQLIAEVCDCLLKQTHFAATLH